MRFEIPFINFSIELRVVGIWIELGRAELDLQFPHGLVPELLWHVPRLFTLNFDRADSPHYYDIRHEGENWVWAVTGDGWRELSVPGYSFRFRRNRETAAQRQADKEHLAEIKIERKLETRLEGAESDEERMAVWDKIRSAIAAVRAAKS